VFCRSDDASARVNLCHKPTISVNPLSKHNLENKKFSTGLFPLGHEHEVPTVQTI
jgi:hypothetical protein